MQHPKDQSVDQRNHLPGHYIYCPSSFPGNIYILPWLQGNIRNISLHWPLIRPRKVVHNIIYSSVYYCNSGPCLLLNIHFKIIYPKNFLLFW